MVWLSGSVTAPGYGSLNGSKAGVHGKDGTCFVTQPIGYEYTAKSYGEPTAGVGTDFVISFGKCDGFIGNTTFYGISFLGNNFNLGVTNNTNVTVSWSPPNFNIGFGNSVTISNSNQNSSLRSWEDLIAPYRNGGEPDYDDGTVDTGWGNIAGWGGAYGASDDSGGYGGFGY